MPLQTDLRGSIAVNRDGYPCYFASFAADMTTAGHMLEPPTMVLE